MYLFFEEIRKDRKRKKEVEEIGVAGNGKWKRVGEKGE